MTIYHIDVNKEVVIVPKTVKGKRRRVEWATKRKETPPKVGSLIILSAEGYWARANTMMQATAWKRRMAELGLNIIDIGTLEEPLQVKITSEERYHW